MFHILPHSATDVGDYLAREKVAQVLRDAVCEATEASKANQVSALQTASVQFDQTGINPPPLDGQARSRAIPPGLGSPAMFGQPPGFRMPYPWYHHSPHAAFPGPPPSPFPPGYRPSHPHIVHQSPHLPRPPHLMGLPTGPLKPFMQAPPGTPSPNAVDHSARPNYSTSVSVSQENALETTQTEAAMSRYTPSYATPAYKRGQAKRSRSLHVGGEKSEDKASPNKKNAVVKASETQTPFVSATRDVESGVNFPPPFLPPTIVAVAAPMEQQAASPSLFIEQHSHQYAARFEPSAVPPQPVMRSYSAPLPDIDPSKGFLSDSDSCHSVDRNWPGRPTESIGAIEPLPVLPGQVNRHHGVPPPVLRPQQGYRTGVTRRQNYKSDRQSTTRTPTGETTEEGFEWFQGQLLLESDEDSEEETPQTPFPI